MVGRDKGHQLAVRRQGEGKEAAGDTAHLFHLTQPRHAHLAINTSLAHHNTYVRSSVYRYRYGTFQEKLGSWKLHNMAIILHNVWLYHKTAKSIKQSYSKTLLEPTLMAYGQDRKYTGSGESA